mmetsp:Transcript_129343/g.235262  ORF Transcript_129343/g.235262 Transcript_129343/m.235262 type:complete len:118 (-) Transcript_129343:186-539(-)
MCLSHGISHTCTYDFLTELQGSRGSDLNPVQMSNSCLFLAVQLRQAEEHQDFMHASLQLRKPYSPSAAKHPAHPGLRLILPARHVLNLFWLKPPRTDHDLPPQSADIFPKESAPVPG